MDTHIERAYAKINLGLDVTGKREDGYHLVDMIMQTVDIYDSLTFKKRGDGEVHLTIEMENGGELSAGEDNLIIRAVRAMQQAFAITDGFDIKLVKRIPVAAGMAGGSSDAAAAFRAVRDLSAPSVTNEKLAEIAVHYGADIPYCIYGGTARAEGIGEKLTFLKGAPDSGLVIVKPPVGVSTPWVYKTLDAGEITERPDIPAMIKAMEKDDLAATMEASGNVLEPVTRSAVPEVGKIEEFLRKTEPVKAMMTGSGPTVFAVYKTKEDAAKAYEAVLQDAELKGYEHFCTEFVNQPYES